MSHEWIKLRKTLITHPKVLHLSSENHWTRNEVIGALFCAWSYFDEHAEDGLIEYISADSLDKIVDLEGFSSALIGVGWMAVERKGLRLPNFSTHNGVGAKNRSLDASRKRAERAAKLDAARVPEPRPDSVLEMSGENTTRKEKKRKEKKREDQENTSDKSDDSSVQVREVFDHWLKQTGRSDQCRLTSDRARCVRGRLREGYTVDQIKSAVTACSKSEFHQGGNRSGKRYDDLTLICRSASKLDAFLDLRAGAAKVTRINVPQEFSEPGRYGGETVRSGLSAWSRAS